MNHKELTEQLKLVIAEANKTQRGTYKYAVLKAKANKLNGELYKTEKMINNFK